MPDAHGHLEATAGAPEIDVLGLHEILDRLAAADSRKARIVELKFFGGLSTEEMAAAEGVSVATVEREWKFARAWLYRELAGPSA